MQKIEIIIHDGKSENKAIMQIFDGKQKIAQFSFSSKEEIKIETTKVDEEKVKIQRI